MKTYAVPVVEAPTYELSKETRHFLSTYWASRDITFLELDTKCVPFLRGAQSMIDYQSSTSGIRGELSVVRGDLEMLIRLLDQHKRVRFIVRLS